MLAFSIDLIVPFNICLLVEMSYHDLLTSIVALLFQSFKQAQTQVIEQYAVIK